MSLIAKAKEALKKKSEETEEIVSSDEEVSLNEDGFDFYKKKWVLAPHMNEISRGNLQLIPIECLLTHYILKYDYHCLYIALDNQETGDDYEIYEFEWVEDGENPDGEKNDPEFKEVESSLNAVECSRFLADRIKEGYKIYIPERKEFDE